MKTFKARGIVLREYEAGEADKRVILLCKEIGKMMVYARGARKQKSKLMAASQLFVYSDYVIADGRQFFSVSQADVIENFYTVRSDYARLCHAQLMLEACDKAIMENTPCDDLLLLLLKSLSLLSKPSAGDVFLPPEQISCVFLFRFYLYYGISPTTDKCCVCGEEAVITADVAYFCDEGYVCRDCAKQKKRRMRLSQTAWAGLRYILRSGVSESFMFNIRPLALDELNKAARLCWDSHFEWKLLSGELIGNT